MNYDIHTTEAHDRTVDDNKEEKDYTFFVISYAVNPFFFSCVFVCK
jgi:hypothetical protein